jgi:hypothetical protein
MGRLPTPIYASEALLAYVILGDGLTEDLRAIRHIDRGSELPEETLDSRGQRSCFSVQETAGNSLEFIPTVGSDA